MSTQPKHTSLNNLSPELLVKIAQSLTSFADLSTLLKAGATHFHNVIVHYQFDICEAIAAAELTPSLVPHFHTLLGAHGDMQRLVSGCPRPSLTTEGLRNTGILSGGTRIGIDEAVQLESYLWQLCKWKPVFLEETRRTPQGCGNMFPDLLGRWNTLVFPEEDDEEDVDILALEDLDTDADAMFALVEVSSEWQSEGLSRKRHERIERAWLNYWTLLLSRVGDERAHAAATVAVGKTRDEYRVWTQEYVKGVEECPEDVRYLAPMYEWLKFIPWICEPLPAAEEEMWDVIMVGGFDYVCRMELGEEVFPAPLMLDAHAPPGVWGDENRLITKKVGKKVLHSLWRLRGLWVLDIHRSLWRGH